MTDRPGSLLPHGHHAHAVPHAGWLLTVVRVLGLLPAIFELGIGPQVSGVLAHPLLIIGGLTVSILASFLLLIRVELHRPHGDWRVDLHIRRRPVDLVLLGLSLVLLLVIAGSLFLENFERR